MSMEGRYATIHVNTDECVGCQHCADVCFQDVYRLNEEKGYIEAKYVEDCASCYQCEMVCPKQCIEVIPSPKQYYDVLERFNDDERYKDAYSLH